MYLPFCTSYDDLHRSHQSAGIGVEEIPNKIVVLSKYSRRGASSRLRTHQFIPYFENLGFHVEFQSLFDDEYLKKLYTGGGGLFKTSTSILNRILFVLFRLKADILLVEKEVLPWFPWFIERWLVLKRFEFIVDYDDALFHRYDLHRFWIVRAILGRKIDCVMENASIVFAGNSYLRSRAVSANAQRIEFVPTVVDIDRYQVKDFSTDNPVFCVGWIGTPETWEAYGEKVFNLLEPFLAENNCRFHAIGAGLEPFSSDVLEIIPWSEESEVSELEKLDVGLMPLADTPWARGKCGYKLIQYMAVGIPVLASPIGVNCDIVESGVNGFLVHHESDWRKHLVTLFHDGELREKMGKLGRKKIEADYSLQVWGPRVAEQLLAFVRSKIHF